VIRNNGYKYYDYGEKEPDYGGGGGGGIGSGFSGGSCAR